MSLGNFERRLFSLLKPSYANKPKGTPRQKSSDRFRHLNMRIAKNNLAYPLLKDMFMLLGGSKCEVLSVLDLKDTFHSLRLTESSKKYCGILPYFGSTSYLYQRIPMELNISPRSMTIIHKYHFELLIQ